MKKIVSAVAAALALASSAAFAQELTFTNEVSSDVVEITIPKSGDTTAAFPGVTEKMAAEFKSEKVDFKVDARVKFVYDNFDNPTEKQFGMKSDSDHWLDGYIEFRPINLITIYLHNGINTAGSYLPVEDDNVAAGNMGANFGVCLRPIEGLRISAGLDESPFADKKLKINVGADYTFGNAFAAGVVANGINADVAVGGFFSFTGVENLTTNLGYSWYKNASKGTFKSVSGNHLIDLGVKYGLGNIPLSFALDVVTGFGGNDAEALYDLYTGANISYGFTEALGANVTFKGQFDFADTNPATADIEVQPQLTFSAGSNSFAFAVNLEFCGNTTIKFPISWSYSF